MWQKILGFVGRSGRKALVLSEEASKRLVRHDARKGFVAVATEALQSEIRSNPIARRNLAEKFAQLTTEQGISNVADILAIDSSFLRDRESKGAPNKDWLFRFFSEAAKISDTDLQHAMGRILAGELEQPGSFSLKTVVTVGGLSKEVAASFQAFSNLALASRERAGVILSVTPLVDRKGGRKYVSDERRVGRALAPFGIDHDDLFEMANAGLINSTEVGAEYPDTYEFLSGPEMEIAGRRVEFDLSGRRGKACDGGDALNVMSISRTGREIRRILALTPIVEYETRLTEVLHNGGIKLIWP